MQKPKIVHSTDSTNLADILERVLDKGVVVAGDIKINIADIELISIRIRLVVASVDKAKELGIDWWQSDPYLSSKAHKEEIEEIKAQNKLLKEKIQKLEKGE